VAQNPKTLERVPVPAKRTVKFKVGRLMKIALELNSEGDLVGHKEAAGIRTARVVDRLTLVRTRRCPPAG